MRAKKKRRRLLYKSHPSLELYDLLRDPSWGNGDDEEEEGAARVRFLDLFGKLGLKRVMKPVGEFASTGVTLLMRAAELGRLVAVQRMIEAGADVFQVDKQNRGLLQYAAAATDNQLQLLELVANALKQQGDRALLKKSLTAVDRQGCNLFHWIACANSQAATFSFLKQLFEEGGVTARQVEKMLLQKNEDDGFTPLLASCDAEIKEAVIAFIQWCPKALEVQSSSSGVNALMVAISKGMLDVVKVILKDATPSMLFQGDEDGTVSTCTSYHIVMKGQI